MYEQRGAQFESELTDLTETAENGEDKEKKGADKRGSDGPRDSLLVSENL